MALFSSIFRRPSHSSQLVPLAVRTVGSARAFDRGISKVPSNPYINDYDYEGRHYQPPSFKKALNSEPHGRPQKLSVQQSLLQGVQSQIETLQKDLDKFRAVEGSDEFPFEIMERGYHHGHHRPLLKRELDDEIVQVSVEQLYMNDPATILKLKNMAGRSGDQEDSHDIPMDVSVFRKSTGMILECNLTASPNRDEICLHRFWIKTVEHSEPSADHCSRAKIGVADLDDDLEKKIVKYLEVLGVKPNTIELWRANLKNRDNRDCLEAMKHFKGFIEGGIAFTGGKKE